MLKRRGPNIAPWQVCFSASSHSFALVIEPPIHRSSLKPIAQVILH